MSNIAINIQNLSKIYKLYDKNIDRLKEAISPLRKKYHKPFYALKNVSFTVKKGEILGIVGRNGTGKSTLLKIISGILTQSSGTCRVHGNISPLLSLATGFNAELTGLENIYLNGTIKGYSKKEMEGKIESILSFAEIGDFIKQPVKTYSSGMNARLAFATAIHIDPEILILDEVLSVGDELFRRKCYTKMEELFQSNCTVLFVSHAMNSINAICTRAIFMERGELILEGPPKFVTSHYQEFLHAKPGHRAAIKAELLELNKDRQKKESFRADPPTGIEDDDPPPRQVPVGEHRLKKVMEDQKELFLEDFTPKSTVVARSFDVDITEMSIRTLEEKQVNALVINREYELHFTANFNISAADVSFGLIFKTLKGMGISGARIPGKKKYLERVEAGNRYNVKVRFRCDFLPNTYFVNLGVMGHIDGEEHRLIHITDALVFKVQDFLENEHAGLVQTVESAIIEKV